MRSQLLSRSLFAIALLVLSANLCPAQQSGSNSLTWPPVTNETKPWTRWWWLGNILDEKMLSTEMAKYEAAGLGGLEITPIYGVRGEEARFIPYLSPKWMTMLDHVLKEGKRLDMGIDMATGTGWPFGGPWVGEEDACKYVTFKKLTVKGGEKLPQPITFTQAQILRLVTGRRDISEIKDPIESNTNLQELAVDQVRFPKRIPLVCLMAYATGRDPLDLTSKVAADGTLDWTAPTGSDWTLYAVFQGPHGKMVERAGPGAEGNVIDHFDHTALDNYLKKFDQAFVGHDISGLRAFFNDSYEVDDATGEATWTPKFFEQFQKRRGYDLKPHLPVLFGDGNPELIAKIRCDYRETISDLLLEEYTQPWLVWAQKYQGITRNQAHGAPANLLDLYAASSIPETEGTEIIRFKSASSAAHVTGKKLASAEASTWLTEHFLETLDETKRWADRYFLGGINHLCYHGTMLSPEEAKWPGWMFYASAHYAPTNPQWKDFIALNEYVTRCQSFLQEGQPDNDVLVYFPIHDVWSNPGRPGEILHIRFDGSPGASTARAVGDLLQSRGYGYDFISDRQLAQVKFENGALNAGGNRYQTIVVPACQRMPEPTLQQLKKLAAAGATVIFQSAIPVKAPGFHTDNSLDDRMLAISKEADLRPISGGTSGKIGTGKFQVADNLELALAQTVQRETMLDQGLGFVRRTAASGPTYYILNQSDKRVNGWVKLAKSAPQVALFNPLTAETGLAHVRNNSEVYLQLAPGESVLLRLGNFGQQQFASVWADGQPQPLTGDWTLKFTSGGPTLPPVQTLTQLKSWTELQAAGVKEFSGNGSYSISFNAPAGNAPAYRLSLGDVKETATVTLNGKLLQHVFAKPFDVTIPAADLKPTGNELVVEVSNLMANRISDMDRKKENYRIFYNTNFPSRLAGNRGPDGLFSAAAWQPLPSGLLGPVTLTPLTKLTPQ